MTENVESIYGVVDPNDDKTSHPAAQYNKEGLTTTAGQLTI